ncbi:hypothetical protein [Flavobacterium sp. J27]|uniref:hypothetical protein n=1 Tax=Flavobacterium sp. J27 TaxID=2060419 RepID=UPI001030AC46|nr:hypothetical protein [Flavobacterium sp. J27]
MKKALFSLSILLVISSSIISYLTVDFNSERQEIAQESQVNNIVLLGDSNSYNPILIVKND